jgi:hypothetical protein
MKKKKLVLRRETLRNLSVVTLREAWGGNSIGCAFSTYGTCAGSGTCDCPPPDTKPSVCEDCTA